MVDYEFLLNSFLNKLNTLEKVLPNMIGKLQYERNNASKEFKKYIKNKCRVITDDSKVIKFEVPLNELRNYNKKKKTLDDLNISIDVIGRSYIVTLVSQYDQFVSELIKTIFSNKPELLKEVNRKLSVSDLVNYENIEKIINETINQEIDIIMRQSHKEQIEYIEGKIKGDIKADKELMKKFIELTERRNIFVHTDGVISQQYLDNCEKEGIVLDKKFIEGYQIIIDPDYFYQSIYILIEMAVKMSTFSFKKLHPDELGKAKDLLMNSIYKCLEFSYYEVVRKLKKYSEKYTKWNKQEEMIININNVLSYYLDGKKDVAVNLLNSFDWSDCSEKFKLARAVINEDNNESAIIMKRIGNSDELPEIYYHQWPLFEKFRETQEFKTVYKEIFGKEFDCIEAAILDENIECEDKEVKEN